MTNVVSLPIPTWEPPSRDGYVSVYRQRPGVWVVEDTNVERGHSGVTSCVNRAAAVKHGLRLADDLCFDFYLEGDSR